MDARRRPFFRKSTPNLQKWFQNVSWTPLPGTSASSIPVAASDSANGGQQQGMR
jgi:hypothetical protein